MRITTGKIPSAKSVVIYGVEKVGKTTLASMFPDPLFIDTEDSTKNLDVKRFDRPTSWTMLLQQVAWVKANPGACETLVIDSVDWAEQLCIAHICAKHQWDGIEQKDYGKGYVYLGEEFGRLLNLLSDLVDSGVHVVLTAHAQVKQFKQPDEATPYDRWELKLQKKTAPLVKEWAEIILFVNYKTFAVTDSKTKKITAQGGKRVMFTTHTPAWDAGNRHSLPEEIVFEGITELPKELAAAIALERGTKAAPAETKAPPAETPVDGLTMGVDAAQAVAETTCDTCGLSGGKHDEECSAVSGHPVSENVVQFVKQVLGDAEAPGDGAIPAHLKKLYDLMAPAGVTVPDIQKAVAHKGYFPEATPIEKYPADFVEGVLIGAWGQVVKLIAELNKIPF